MVWAPISILETAPGARILKSLMFRMRDNPILSADQASAGVPTSERPRVPQCLRTYVGDTSLALGKGVSKLQYFSTPKWRLQVRQTPGAWSITSGPARTYFIELWGAGASGNTTATNRGGGSGSYEAVLISAGAFVTVGGVVGAGGAAGAAGWNAGTDTTVSVGPGTATAYGAPATGAGGGLPIFGGVSTLISRFAGLASLATGPVVGSLGPYSSFGAVAPMLGGCGPTASKGGAFGRATPGAGGAGGSGGGGNSQAGGDGMVLIWYLD